MIDINKTTISTDSFESFESAIITKWKINPKAKISVVGKARKTFEDWVSKNYPQATKNEEGYYCLDVIE